MYSVVLMMALSGGVDAVEHGRNGGCNGCYGGRGGVVVNGCYGGCGGVVVAHGCNGCYGGCNGKHGGGRGFLGGLFGGRRGGKHGGNGCNGCYGGCNGSGCYGSSCHGGVVVPSACYGGCHGGAAIAPAYAPAYGCSGGLGFSGGHGCTGGVIDGGFGCTGGVIDGGHGCTGGGVIINQGGPVYGAPYGPQGGVAPEQPKVMPKVEKGRETEKIREVEKTREIERSREKKGTFNPGQVQNVAPATIVVSLPADARLTVDGVATKSTSTRRTLVTPALETGSNYVYTLRAEVVRDGQPVVQTQQVTVRAGETTQVPFTFSNTGVASR